MESKKAIKPPWVLSASAWQRRRQPVPPVSTDTLPFSSWMEDMEATTLMQAKAKITALEASRRWELIKKMANPYEMVYTHEDPAFHPSISMIKPLSRSYFKLIEMLHVMQFFEELPKQNPKLRTAHVAEGPGGFIQAVVELVSRHKKLLSKATAMTLRPTDPHVPGWRRAAGFLHHHKEVKLIYGADNTGNVYNMENQKAFVESVAPGVHLFTADGGFDFSVNYSIQEKSVFHLLVCSAAVGIQSLLQGGSMVLKLFDMYSESTRIVLLLLSRCFREWMIYKPALSRPCNSERYFIGRGFLGASPKMVKLFEYIQLKSEVGEFPTGFSEIVSEEEGAYFKTHVEENAAYQLAALSKADAYIENPNEWYTKQLPLDFETSLQWCHAFRVPPQMTQPKAISAAGSGRPPQAEQTSSPCDRPLSQ
jgi:23S rRNA U2552 (ribose-2'-O)-methylase RlmE/FtsJ